MSASARQLGRYELLRRVALGGTAEVFLARDREMGRLVAVKRPLQHLSAELALEIVGAEARALACVHDPRVVALVGQGEQEGWPFLVEEWVPGRHLFALVRSEAMPVPLVARVVAEAARGLHAIHQARDASGGPLGLIHRDVTPDNLALCADGGVKVLDLGIAKALLDRSRHATTAGVLKGKYRFHSPEQLLGNAVDARSDLFQLGLTLFFLLTRKHAFEGGSEYEIFEAVQRQPAERPSLQRPEVEPALDAVVLRALEKRPADRFANALEMAEALEAVLGARPEGSFAALEAWAWPRLASALDESADPELERQLSRPRSFPAAPNSGPHPVLPLQAQPRIPSQPALNPVAVSLPRPTAVREPAPASPRVSVLAPAAIGLVVVAGLAFRLGQGGGAVAPPPRPPVAAAPTAPAPTAPVPPAVPVAPPAPVVVVAPPVPSPPPIEPVAPEPTVAVVQEEPVKGPRRRIREGASAPAVAAVVAAPAVVAPVVAAPGIAAPGTLQLRVLPWAEVEVDGVALGTTPLADQPLPAGRHRVLLRHPPSGASESREVEVLSGQVTVVRHRFE